MAYHALRSAGGVPVDQLGMNVKQYIRGVQSELFRALDARKHPDYRGGFEPIPDVVIFGPEIAGDWRRRRAEQTLAASLLVIEVKVSERARRRLTAGEVISDIRKLAAHRAEATARGTGFHPIVLVLDTAPEAIERMTASSLSQVREAAEVEQVELRYVNSSTS